GELGEVSETRAADIRRWIVEERGALSRIDLSIAGAPTAQLSLDGRDLGAVRLGERRRILVDAGRRTLLARAEGFAPAEEILFAERAAEQQVTLHLEALPTGS